VTLPAGKWRYFFNDKEVIEGPKTFEREFPLDEYPVYVREGSITPMNISRDYTQIGDKSSTGFLTYLIYPSDKSEFTVSHPDKSGSTTVQVESTSAAVQVSLSGQHKAHILAIHLDRKPASVKLDGALLLDSLNYSFDEKRQRLNIKTENYQVGKYVVVK